MPTLTTLPGALSEIKSSIESAILAAGTTGKNNLIRSQKPIKLLHEVVKSELVLHGVDPSLVFPPLGKVHGELSLAGFFKRKDQDVCVVQKNQKPVPEILELAGLLYGETDMYGFDFTEKTLSVNVRSQLSSSAKNFDTLYERTFAEAFNLHLRCPKMVLGELYMIAVNEYDSMHTNQNQVRFRKVRNIEKHIEKYLLSFQAVNGRNNVSNDHFKYERVCLLIVDFSADIPKVYGSDDSLKQDKLLPANSKASVKNLDFDNFIAELLAIYDTRFGVSNFK